MPSSWSERFEIKPGRWVYVPTSETLSQGRALKSEILKRFSPPLYYFHLRAGGHVEALKSHMADDYFITIDIKNFFGCMTRGRLTRVLTGYFSYTEAREIARNSTVRDPGKPRNFHSLPYGFPQSTLLASMCLRHSAFGNHLERLSEEFKVSVYVDDIVLSSNEAAGLSKAAQQLIDKAARSHFPLNEKTNPMPEGKTTIFNIELRNNSLKVCDAKMIEFQSEIAKTDNQKVIDGILSYVGSINDVQRSYLENLT